MSCTCNNTNNNHNNHNNHNNTWINQWTQSMMCMKKSNGNKREKCVNNKHNNKYKHKHNRNNNMKSEIHMEYFA